MRVIMKTSNKPASKKTNTILLSGPKMNSLEGNHKTDLEIEIEMYIEKRKKKQLI